MSYLRRSKGHKEIVDPRELEGLNEFLDTYNAKDVGLFMIMGKAAEAQPNGPYSRAIELYASKVNDKIKEMEREIIWEGQSLITRHLLDDLGEEDYVESMEMCKEELRMLRRIQAYVDFLSKKRVHANIESDEVVIVDTNPNK